MQMEFEIIFVGREAVAEMGGQTGQNNEMQHNGAKAPWLISSVRMS